MEGNIISLPIDFRRQKKVLRGGETEKVLMSVESKKILRQ